MFGSLAADVACLVGGGGFVDFEVGDGERLWGCALIKLGAIYLW